ncbi:MAG: 16S rRNA (adenine(1518)-N(6)/adenine(1519)-N(6))-dimethyltransferase RsmA [Victivallaceae bacterium]
MKRSSPEKITSFFKANGKRPRKSFSQNFLIDANIVRKIVAVADISDKDSILEIGPGYGALTEFLVATGANVVVVEKDLLFQDELEKLPITVFMQDIKDFSFAALPEGGKVVANLPYHITTPILIMLFEKALGKFNSVTVMIQKEMAQRAAATPSSVNYGSFSVFLAFHANVKIAFNVSPSCFFPKPAVHSSVVHMTVKKEFPLPLNEREAFFKMTRKAFHMRRKMLVNALEALYDKEKVRQGLERMSKSPQVRAENLSLEDFVLLYRFLNP